MQGVGVAWLPGVCPYEISQILGVEVTELGQSLSCQYIQEMLLRLVGERSKGPHDVCDLLRLALISLHNKSSKVHVLRE